MSMGLGSPTGLSTPSTMMFSGAGSSTGETTGAVNLSTTSCRFAFLFVKFRRGNLLAYIVSAQVRMEKNARLCGRGGEGSRSKRSNEDRNESEVVGRMVRDENGFEE
jgi:hypothetical protein